MLCSKSGGTTGVIIKTRGLCVLGLNVNCGIYLNPLREAFAELKLQFKFALLFIIIASSSRSPTIGRLAHPYISYRDVKHPTLKEKTSACRDRLKKRKPCKRTFYILCTIHLLFVHRISSPTVHNI